jgi:predicted secreted Zn-dependent protease
LTWEDFKGRYRKEGNTAAKSFVNIGRLDYKMENGNLLVTVAATNFSQRKSWVLKDRKGNYELLKHEQVHFDIAEVYSRKLKKRIRQARLKPKMKKNQKVIYKTHEAIIKEYKVYQALYDKETKHHLNEAKQKEWNKKVAEELKCLEEYAKSELIIDLRKKK